MTSKKILVKADWSAHVRIMRVDHWIKNLFMFPGVVLALAFEARNLNSEINFAMFVSVGVGFCALCFISSANYVINEYLDREKDRIHPLKGHRAANYFKFSGQLITLHYFCLVLIAGLFSVKLENSSRAFLFLLLVMGILYNVRPIRLKDLQYLDVISESVNNPIRLAIGWHCVSPKALVPASAFLAFWGLGIFLMSLKRYVEMKLINDKSLLETYRKSFAKWNPEKLLVTAFVGSFASAFFTGVLLGRRNVDYFLVFPAFLATHAEYLRVSLALSSSSIAPEKLMRNKRLVTLSIVTLLSFILISFSRSQILTKFFPVING